MKIELTDENMKQLDNENETIIVNGEEWEFVERDNKEYDEQGFYQTLYYKQISTGKIFMINLFYVMHGYEDYCFEPEYQTKEAIEVEKVIVQIEKWRVVE